MKNETRKLFDGDDSEFKDNLRERGILPILKDNNLFIYEISAKKGLYKLSIDCSENLFDIYKTLVLNGPKFKEDICKSSYLPFFRNMISYRPATTEEVWEYFNLNNEQSRNDFIEKNAQEIEVHIPIDDMIYTKGYRKEEIQEIVQRKSQDYVTCTFKRNSKLSAIINFINFGNYFDLDHIASLTCEFLYSKKVNFSTGFTILRKERRKIDEMQFTDKEKSLSEDDKIKLIKNIVNALNIKCIYCEEVDKISDSLLQSILESDSKKTAIDFAKHNTDILYNSDFSPIYRKIISPKSKTLKKKQN